MKLLALLALLALALLTGCFTPYESNGLWGGYSDVQLGEDAFRVSFLGNGYTSEDRVQDFVLLRAAELTLQHGYKWFAVINEKNSPAGGGALQMPGQSTGSATATTYGKTTVVTGSATYVPGPTYNFVFPHSGLLIRCFHDKPEMFAFDAGFLRRSLTTKYHLHLKP